MLYYLQSIHMNISDSRLFNMMHNLLVVHIESSILLIWVHSYTTTLLLIYHNISVFSRVFIYNRQCGYIE
jgi:hypothetical protein